MKQHIKEVFKIDQKNKYTFVFVHGFNSTWYKHRPLLEKIYSLGINILAFDLPNHGKNDEFDKQLKFNEYCKYAIKKINNIKQNNIILLGHSMGGGIVSVIHNKLKVKPIGIILEDPLQKYGVINNKLNAAIRLFSMFRTQGLEGIKDWFTPNNSSMNTTSLLLEINSQDVGNEICKCVEEINCKTLVLFGENDDIIDPKNSIEYFTKAINKKLLTVEIIKNAKHSPDIENLNDTWNVISKFIKSIIKE